MEINFIEPKVHILFDAAFNSLIEKAGRTCYKSEDKITPHSADNFVQKMIKSGHHSVIEHSMLTIKFIIDRGVSHELVRHRPTSISQESTRFCNYKDVIEFVKPPFWAEDTINYDAWKYACTNCAGFYETLLLRGNKPEEARTVLNNSLKTEVVMTANYREWRHIINLRSSKQAHPQIRQVMIPLGQWLFETNPYVFDNDLFEEEQQWKTVVDFNAKLADVMIRDSFIMIGKKDFDYMIH